MEKNAFSPLLATRQAQEDGMVGGREGIIDMDLNILPSPAKVDGNKMPAGIFPCLLVSLHLLQHATYQKRASLCFLFRGATEETKVR